MLAFQCYNECEFLYAYPDGTVRARKIRLYRLFWGEQVGNPGEQWLIEGQDLDSGDIKEFALKNIMVPTAEQQRSQVGLALSADGDGNGRKQDPS